MPVHAPGLFRISAKDGHGVQDQVYGQQQQHEGSFTHEALAVRPQLHSTRPFLLEHGPRSSYMSLTMAGRLDLDVPASYDTWAAGEGSTQPN